MKKNLFNLVVGSFLTATGAFAQCPIPRADEIQTLCFGAKVGDIVASAEEGATLNYMFIGFITQPVEPEVDIIDGGWYGVTQTVNGCTSGIAHVRVNLTETPAEAGGTSPQQFSAGETIANLEISVIDGYEVRWYVMDGNSEMIRITNREEALVDGQTYYVTQSNGFCESPFHAITVNQIMGTGNSAFRNFKLYPNPANQLINLSNSEAITQVTITNVLGQKVLGKSVNANNAEVNISGLTAGTYILQATTATGSTSLKVVKQ
ncbi:T9SS type A sorting domain-containing protein [Flavobacterium sp. Sd200]|uniref:T9SS type A sorting domain-containing protein n=1 Tax=Flavobacterium sp. Sd200 TaxID=2692211 RepID=UPI00136AF085|nr:T9SS type A sorting domain-containing protein [Flavobacterium sp. Sd200]MXN92625.1 T9SS type A sorting domain-containing protein [Flavobacterium sp. Sd200]